MSYSGNCNYSLAGPISNHYSTLESIAYHSAPADNSNINYLAEALPTHQPIFYQPQATSLDPYKQSTATLYHIQKTNPTNIEYSFIPDDFLVPGRMKRFIDDAEEIEKEIKEAFQATTGFDIPPDIQITVCSPSKFKSMISQPGVRGFSINRKTQGLISEIFVLNSDLAHVMLTTGHEIGHVLSKPLKDKRLEEAKAFAFSKAWMKAIKKHNIGDLRDAIILDNPAPNGIHDVAHAFINKFQDKDPLQLYWEIVRGQHDIPIVC
jgi:hypothetical protein